MTGENFWGHVSGHDEGLVSSRSTLFIECTDRNPATCNNINVESNGISIFHRCSYPRYYHLRWRYIFHTRCRYLDAAFKWTALRLFCEIYCSYPVSRWAYVSFGIKPLCFITTKMKSLLRLAIRNLVCVWCEPNLDFLSAMSKPSLKTKAKDHIERLATLQITLLAGQQHAMWFDVAFWTTELWFLVRYSPIRFTGAPDKIHYSSYHFSLGFPYRRKGWPVVFCQWVQSGALDRLLFACFWEITEDARKT